MGERTKATDTKHIRQEILERDNYNCVACGTTQALTIAHVFVNRSHGGLAVKENLCVLCMDCHHKMDNGKTVEQELIRHKVQYYMIDLYGHINTKKLKYYKWE